MKKKEKIEVLFLLIAIAILEAAKKCFRTGTFSIPLFGYRVVTFFVSACIVFAVFALIAKIIFALITKIKKN